MAENASGGRVKSSHGLLHGTHAHDHDHHHHHDHDHDHHPHHHGHEHGHGHDCGHEHHHSATAFHSHGVEIELDFSIMLGISLLCGTFLLFGHLAEWRGDDPMMSTICFALAIIVGGAIPLLEALPGLLRMRPDVESLMVVAALGAWFLGEPSEGAVLMLMFSLARALEGYAVGRTRHQLNALKEHWNESATRLVDAGEEEVPFSELRAGDRILVRPGGRIAVDGTVREGSSAVNEAAITGEPLPVDKSPGDSVYGGSLNLQGVLTIEVTSGAGESTLSRMIRLIEEAQEQEALTQRVVEWTTERYSTFVLLSAMVILAVPHIYFRQPLDICLYRAFALLVVASPCALVISTPATILMAITAASRRGILLKGGVHLEAAAAVRVVALDKTGTLTRGEPRVTTIHATDGDADELLGTAGAVERLSEHPLARPVVEAARERGLSLAEADEFLAVTGRGVQAKLGDDLVRIGSPRWMEELGIAMPESVRAAAEPLEERGERTLFVAVGDEMIGLLSLADTIRPEAAALIRDLKRTGIKRVVMLTGDTAAAATAIGEACGIDEVRADLLPSDKLAALEDLRSTYGRVIMVGDGINDAPALAASDVGVAMGAIGSDLALESADVILVKDDLWRLPAFVDLAKKATRMILFNLAFALGVIGVMTFLVFRSAASTGSVSLTSAVYFHEGSTLIVVANAMRLLRWRSRYDERL